MRFVLRLFNVFRSPGDLAAIHSELLGITRMFLGILRGTRKLGPRSQEVLGSPRKSWELLRIQRLRMNSKNNQGYRTRGITRSVENPGETQSLLLPCKFDIK